MPEFNIIIIHRFGYEALPPFVASNSPWGVPFSAESPRKLIESLARNELRTLKDPEPGDRFQVIPFPLSQHASCPVFELGKPERPPLEVREVRGV